MDRCNWTRKRMSSDSGAPVLITGGIGENGVGMDTLPGDGAGMVTEVGVVAIVVEDIPIMITTGNMLLTRKSSQQQTNLTYQLKPS
jgi:hypothetical protein